MSETAQEASNKKPATEVQNVLMEDGRTVGFAGKRKVVKEVLESENAIRINFINGRVLTYTPKAEMVSRLALHGASQKIGDEFAGVAEVDDMVLAGENMITRLDNGEWGAARQAGDSFAGTSIVIKAVCEVSGKSVEEVKAFLNGKIEAAKAAGQKLSRADLYASFRKPGTKTAAVIERLEAEKNSKSSVDSEALLGELGAA